MAAAYYNEIDPYAAQWLRNLIAKGLIAPGDVDERSIEDVHPSDLKNYAQCHFFAGIGIWSYALRKAGWPDDKPVWTGSCPCQPFSAAGKGAGFADERHLWPAWHWLIQECRPAIIFGEQVASKNSEPWIDLVSDDLEALGYAVGAISFPAASVGAPHIRERLYWVADARRNGSQRRLRGWPDSKREAVNGSTGCGGATRGLADTNDRCEHPLLRSEPNHTTEDLRGSKTGGPLGHLARGYESEPGGFRELTERPTGPTNGFWRAADWLLCRDGKWRPVEPGYEQMADGSARSLGRVRACAVEEIEGQIDEWSIRYQTDGGEGLRRVWGNLQAQAVCERETGRFSGVQSPAVLLAFLRQLTEQGWRFSDTLACARTEASETVVRVLRFDPQAARTPLRRELAEQCAGEPSDALRELSSLLAHHAAQCWGEACREKAGAASFPLAVESAARVGRLRAYGNAIVAPQAQVFIETVMDWLGYGDL